MSNNTFWLLVLFLVLLAMLGVIEFNEVGTPRGGV